MNLSILKQPDSAPSIHPERVPEVDAEANFVGRIVLAINPNINVRYLIHTEIFDRLKDLGCQIVLLCHCPSGKIEHYCDGRQVISVSISPDIGHQFTREHLLQRLIRAVRPYVNAGSVPIAEDHWRADFAHAVKEGGVKTRLVWTVLHATIRLLRRSRSLRRMLLKVESTLVPNQYLETLRRLQPDLVVTTSLGIFENDHFVLRAANRCGIPSAAIVMSWDNSTAKGYPAAAVDHIIAWTEIMRKELIRYNDIPASKISVLGAPIFDRHFARGEEFSKRDFLNSIGCDPDKKMILVATKSPKTYAHNPNIIETLAQAVESGKIQDSQIVVRIHPLHYSADGKDGNLKNAIDKYKEIEKRYPFVILNEPVNKYDTVFDGDSDESIFVSRLVGCSDVLVNIFSTMNIEGAIMDVPLVNCNFDDEPVLYDVKRSYRHDINIDHGSIHNQRIIRSGGTAVVPSSDELVAAVGEYLQDPQRDRDGRQRIVETEGGPNQGRAGHSVANRLFEIMWAGRAKDQLSATKPGVEKA